MPLDRLIYSSTSSGLSGATLGRARNSTKLMSCLTGSPTTPITPLFCYFCYGVDIVGHEALHSFAISFAASTPCVGGVSWSLAHPDPRSVGGFAYVQAAKNAHTSRAAQRFVATVTWCLVHQATMCIITPDPLAKSLGPIGFLATYGKLQHGWEANRRNLDIL